MVIMLSSGACNQNATSETPAQDEVEPSASVVSARIKERTSLENGVLKTVLLVPRDALIVGESGTYIGKVFERGDKSVYVEIPVKEVRAIDGEWLSVVPNLAAGDQVVIRADERLLNGREVEVIGDDKFLAKQNDTPDSR